jgi:hypothetical protein
VYLDSVLTSFYCNINRAWCLLRGNEATCRSQWPRGMRHEMSSPARTLGSWVLISLKACMFVYVYFVFLLSCVHVMWVLWHHGMARPQVADGGEYSE